MPVDNRDNFSAFFLLLWVIDTLCWVIIMLSTYICSINKQFMYVINSMFTTCKVNNFPRTSW